MKKLQTNEDFVRNLMNFSPRGALCQVFVIYAIEQYAKEVAKRHPDEFDSGLINGQAWHDVAVDIAKRVDEFYAK